MQAQFSPSDLQLTMESIRFFAWLIGSLCGGAIAVVGIYLRLYVHDALLEHARAIEEIVAEHYVRKDVHAAEGRYLRSLINDAGGQ